MDPTAILGMLPIGNGASGPLILGEFLCVGAGIYGCSAKSAQRSWYCPACSARANREIREQLLAQAKQSLSPDGVLDWCVLENPKYLKATRRIREALSKKTDEFYDKDNQREAEHFERLANRAALPTATLGALIVGERRIGKSKLLTAIGLTLYRYALTVDRDTMTVEAYEKLMRLVSGLRFVNGIALARAAMDSGGWKNSALYHEACNASLLLLDETGFEETKSDGTLIRDLLRMRYEPSYRPTVMVSAATIAELNDRYGEGAMSTVWERGLLVDLHGYSPPEDA